jgi:hypothetical protein
MKMKMKIIKKKDIIDIKNIEVEVKVKRQKKMIKKKV